MLFTILCCALKCFTLGKGCIKNPSKNPWRKNHLEIFCHCNFQHSTVIFCNLEHFQMLYCTKLKSNWNCLRGDNIVNRRKKQWHWAMSKHTLIAHFCSQNLTAQYIYALHYPAPHCTALHCTALHCTAQWHCSVRVRDETPDTTLHYTAPQYTTSQHCTGKETLA